MDEGEAWRGLAESGDGEEGFAPRLERMWRLVFPRQPKHDRICLADFFRPLESGERDVVALQGVTVGPEVTELIERLESEGEFAEQLYVHGLGVQAAEGLAEWLHSRVRTDLGIELDQGRGYSWGYYHPVRGHSRLGHCSQRRHRRLCARESCTPQSDAGTADERATGEVARPLQADGRHQGRRFDPLSESARRLRACRPIAG